MPQRDWNRILESRRTILLLSFFVMGVLAVPLIMKSPVFSRGEKWMWSILVTLWTALLLALAGWSVYWSYVTIRETLSTA